jgi:hypothetical protein
MISFRKHAAESTRRPNSFLGRGLRVASAAPRFALLTLIIASAASGGAASPRAQQPQDKARQQEDQAGTKGSEPAAESPANSGGKAEPIEEAKIPIRVTRVETADGPGVLATIGEFPSDLNEAGQEFLKREFFEHFASDVLGLGDSDSTRATLKVAMLPQEKENQREGDFIFGKLSGHMVVLVEKRRVLVACTFSEAERKPQLLAAVRRLWARVGV